MIMNEGLILLGIEKQKKNIIKQSISSFITTGLDLSIQANVLDLIKFIYNLRRESKLSIYKCYEVRFRNS